MGHGSDKLYVTHSEHQSANQHTASSGGFQKKTTVNFASLPYTHCALSLQPFSADTAVCNSEGICYDLLNIIPYLKKHGKDPVSKKKLSPSDLIRLHFAKNSDGDYHDPLTFRVFTNHTPIVAIKTTGNVFSKDTVDRLNIKAGFWKDLLTDEPFKREDIIVIQDPHNPNQRDLKRFQHLDADLKPIVEPDEGASDGVSGINVGATGGASSLIKAIAAKQKEDKEKEQAKQAENTPFASTSKATPASTAKPEPWNSSKLSTGRAAASLTSTSATVYTQTDRLLYDEDQLMFDAIKDKGYVQLKTNFGDINLELHCDKAPRTCYNFLSLAKNRKYDDTVFHRLVPGFMIQGGDPTGTGRGGESIWGQPFNDEFSLRGALKHDKRGVLSMANSGPNTNSSQFFITFQPTPHLNGKHTVFGRVVGSMDALDKMELINVQPKTNRPLKPIKLFDAAVFKNPYEEYRAKLAKKLERDGNAQTGVEATKRKREERDKDRTTWFGTTLDEPKTDAKLSTDGLGGVGKYLKTVPVKPAAGEAQPAPAKKRKAGGGFGDFSAW